MTFQVGRKKTGGRRAGTPNKSSAELKNMILDALNKKGGVDYLVKLPDNLFVSLLTKILPKNGIDETSEDNEVNIFIRGYNERGKFASLEDDS